MTIIESIKTEEQIIRENRNADMRKWREKNKARNNAYHREYYHKNRETIMEKRYGKSERFCKWCGADISHIFPRRIAFCNETHRKYYNAKRKRQWFLNKRMQKISELQHSEVSVRQ